MKFVSLEHFGNQSQLLLVHLSGIVKKSEVIFESGRYIGVHVAQHKNDIVG